MKIGSHVGNNGDLMLAGSLIEALDYNSNCFMIYLGPPQSTFRKSFNQYNSDVLKEGLEKFAIDINDIIIHAPYIVNLGSPEVEKRNFGINFIVSEVNTMSKIGFKYLVVHPGSYTKSNLEEGISNISFCIKEILEKTKDSNVSIALETMSGKGSECGFRFEQIKKIIDNVNDDRVVVCFDTCHVHDAGYDIVNNYNNVLTEFDNLVGLDKIKVFHLNDSKNEIGAKKDRHENIGFGKIGFETILKFAHDQRFINVPKILETPYIDNKHAPYKYEIEMIKKKEFNSLVKEGSLYEKEVNR